MTRSVHASAVASKSGSHDARSTMRCAPRWSSRASSLRAKPQKLAYEESPNPSTEKSRESTSPGSAAASACHSAMPLSGGSPSPVVATTNNTVPFKSASDTSSAPRSRTMTPASLSRPTHVFANSSAVPVCDPHTTVADRAASDLLGCVGRRSRCAGEDPGQHPVDPSPVSRRERRRRRQRRHLIGGWIRADTGQEAGQVQLLVGVERRRRRQRTQRRGERLDRCHGDLQARVVLWERRFRRR